MLINQQNPNILPLRCEALERSLDISRLRLGVYDEEVLLRVGRGGDVLWGVQLVCVCSLPPWSIHSSAGSFERV